MLKLSSPSRYQFQEFSFEEREGNGSLTVHIFIDEDPTQFYERLAKITVLTSVAGTASPNPPSLSDNDWISRDYRGPAYDAVGIIDLKPAVLARHVAVFSENDDKPLSLAEVEIYGKIKISKCKTRFVGN